MRHRGLRKDDVMVASYPRSGNTWIRFVLADVATGEPADFESVDRLIPNVGQHRDSQPTGGVRLVKTHERFRSDYHRSVYIVRDVRDVLVSWYRVTRADPDDLSDFDDYVREFATDQASPYGRWDDHVRSWQRARESGQPILERRFEDMRAEPLAGIRQVAEFAGLQADDTAIQRALERNTSERMRQLEREGGEYLRNAFGHMSKGVREGSGGHWRDLLKPDHERILAPLLELNRELGYE